MPLLADIFSAGNTAKRKMRAFAADPVAEMQKWLAQKNEDAAEFNRLDRIAGDAQYNRMMGKPVSPEQMAAFNQVNDIVANAYNPAGITVYHGSPQLFSRFDPMKMGTGEGAQAYGVGAGYTSEARPIAEKYAMNVSRSKVMQDQMQAGKSAAYANEVSQIQQMVGDMPIQDYYTKLELQASRLPIDKSKDAYAKLDIVEQLGLGSNIPAVKQYAQEAGYSKPVLDWIEKDLAPQYKPAGYLYKGDIPDELLPKFLHWDKKFSEQTPEVQSAIKEYWEKNKVYGDPTKYTGAGIYDSIVAHVYGDAGRSGAQRAASQQLNSIGLRGIRYTDVNDNNLAANFIPFRPEDFKIQEINDIPLSDWYAKGFLKDQTKAGKTVDMPLSMIEHGEAITPGGSLSLPGASAKIQDYASKKTPFPAIDIVSPDEWNGKFMIADGSHRYEAAKLRGDKTIPVTVSPYDTEGLELLKKIFK